MGIGVGCQGLSRVIDELFSYFEGRFVFNFMDDLVVYSPSLDQHERHLRRVFQSLQEAGFTLDKDKITLVASEIRYLGHYLSSRGIKVIHERVEAIRVFPRPHNLRSLRRFLDMANFYARFIPRFSEKVAPLHGLKRKGARFVWGTDQQASFDSLKRALSEAPVLQIPDFEKEFVLVTDASDVAPNEDKYSVLGI
jgi:hypothetical protein